MNTNYPSATEDKELVSKILEGDRYAFSILIRRTEKLVAQMVFSMVLGKAELEDLAQEVYLKVYKYLPGFRFQCKLSTWVGQITYNTCLNYLRKKRPFLLRSFSAEAEAADELEELMFKNIGAMENLGEARLEAEDLKEAISTVLEQISPLYQLLIGLYHQQELSLQEVAKVTGLPEGTVKSYLFRARKELKKKLLSGYKRDEL